MFDLLQQLKSVPQHISPAVLFRLGLIYAGYRLALSFFLIALFLATLNNPIIGSNEPYLYLNILAGYSFITLFSYVTLRHWQHQMDNQLSLMLVIDICTLTLMLYANGGPNLQMTMFYLVVVMAANTLLSSKRAFVIALFAAITVIYQQFFYSLAQAADPRGIGGAALLGLSFVAISVFTQLITRRLKVTEQLAEDRSDEISQLQAINQQIIEQSQTGLLVLNQQQEILVINKAAQTLLFDHPYAFSDLKGQPIQHFNADLSQRIQSAIDSSHYEFLLSQAFNARKLNIQLSILNQGSKNCYFLLTIQSLQHINQQVQQLKLASLGQLTASIAHEVRNPLAAISQATELLAEGSLNDSDQALLHVIKKQTQRLNQTIENVLQMSRRKPANPETIDLPQWLPQMIQDNLLSCQPFIQIQLQPVMNVWFDPFQLQHILVNLLQNAVHHSKKVNERPIVKVIGSQDEQQQIILDVMDSGPGLTNAALKTLFEPFFTTEPNGTGLGLYLSKAFCDANGAQLLYVPQTRGACFRIIFRSCSKSC
jgi:two-component system sensor histidine kinase PilS (NtrC family)